MRYEQKGGARREGWERGEEIKRLPVVESKPSLAMCPV